METEDWRKDGIEMNTAATLIAIAVVGMLAGGLFEMSSQYAKTLWASGWSLSLVLPCYIAGMVVAGLLFNAMKLK